MRILQLCPRSPWPPRDGGRVAMLQLTRSVAASGVEIDVLALNPRKHFIDPAVAADGLHPVRFDTITIDTSAIVRPLVRSVIAREPFLVSRFHARKVETFLRLHLRAHRYDVVLIESPFLSAYVPLVRSESDALIVLRAQNVEFRIWEGLAANARGARAVARSFVARGLREWEIAQLNRFDAIIPITDADAAEFRTFGCIRPMHVLPCSIEAGGEEDGTAADPRALYFIGSMKYRPNVEAASWIIDELWPRIRGIEPECTLTLAGLDFPDALAARARAASIRVEANVPDLRRFSARFGVMIAPLLSGGGMRVKVLESMAMGKAVVATTIGAGGLDLTPGREVLIEDDVDSFAQAVVRCVRNPELSRSLGKAARARVRALYDPERLGAGLRDFLEALVSGERSSA